ncbi:MAG: hypothetical protein PF795_15430 [Kiritimatiellae bacterium]|jgi:hypothetical protein|nr:hypothetical protein [Kiritimatiellia bacterium]
MSVEITGPRGYEWQYRITSLIAIQNLSCEALIIEPAQGEDASLYISDSRSTRVIEIQAKSSSEDIYATDLTRWLAHFEKRETSTLLDRLLEDSERMVLFVPTEAGLLMHFGV